VPGKVIFALTEDQAEALRAIKQGRRVPGQGRGRRLVLSSMRRKGLTDADSEPARLTPMGEAAVALCERLASPARIGEIDKTNKFSRGFEVFSQ